MQDKGFVNEHRRIRRWQYKMHKQSMYFFGHPILDQNMCCFLIVQVIRATPYTLWSNKIFHEAPITVHIRYILCRVV